MTLQNAIDEFLIEQQIRGNSEKTVLYYSRCLGFFSNYNGFFARSVGSISLSDCKAYLLYLKTKNITTTTIQTYIRALRSFLSWCYSEGYIDTNIPEHFKLPKAKRKTIDVLTDEEIQRLFSCLNGRDFHSVRNYCIVALMLDSGLRLNEVVTLNRDKIHIVEGYIIVNGKGNKERIVPLGMNSKKALLRYISIIPNSELQTPLFLKDTLTPIKQSTVKQLFRRLKSVACIPRLRPHLLRHSFATRYLENGGDIYSLQLILGHTSLEMVKKYVHLTSSKTTINFGNYSPLDKVLKK
ncbi:MAG: tyrosine-type recombinase/integrase [Acutalibacteraceae bacterium]